LLAAVGIQFAASELAGKTAAFDSISIADRILNV